MRGDDDADLTYHDEAVEIGGWGKVEDPLL